MLIKLNAFYRTLYWEYFACQKIIMQQFSLSMFCLLCVEHVDMFKFFATTRRRFKLRSLL